MEYIDQHLHETIRLDDFSEHVHLSNNYLSTLFKKETGYTVSEYILSRKLEVAENMLRFSDFSCAEISSFLSFNSQSYFTQCFREKNGCTPAVFRKTHYNKHIQGRHK
ncbi:helix-turn-helix domain-containing protein [Butyrivibrio sp. AE3004]|uniref:helix-turn-helix transcriptional regulator n=1 Tax=Butyrivibrio sp. AE3004 TaxID=1506994 RepID=UPI0009E0B167